MENKSQLNIHNEEHFRKVLDFAIQQNKVREFIAGVNYLMTYSENQCDKVIVDLFSDRSAGEYSFVASINRIVYDDDENDYKTKRIIVIGMVWNKNTKTWGFHS